MNDRQAGCGILAVLLIVSAASVLAGCSYSPGRDGEAGATLTQLTVSSPPKAQAVITMAPVPIIEPPRTVVAVFDVTSSFPADYLDQAKRLAADFIDQMVHPGQPGATVFIQAMDENSFDPTKTVLVIQVPQVPNVPVPPRIPPDPTPEPTPTPYDFNRMSRQERATATAVPIALTATANRVNERRQNQIEAADTWYKEEVRRHNTTVAQQKGAVKESTDKLRRWEPQLGRVCTDVWGSLARASGRLQDALGARQLIIVSDLEQTCPVGTPPQVSLKGVRVTIAFFHCTEPKECEQRKLAWDRVFREAGALDVQWLDPGQSLAVKGLFPK